ncbi:hypothetical protein B0H14DRAFT_3857455 [Mycena olivaceomarginata]|nr:hypothetical protein B0H14DRAFT_3857455 [Mycena olivaceomarginata]
MEDRKPVTVPTRYQLPNATLVLDDSVRDVNTLVASFLKICLHYVDKENEAGTAAGSKDLIWESRPTKTEYPVPDLYFEVNSTNTASFVKERAVVSLMRLTAQEEETTRVSELTVERLVGSALSGIFNMPRSDVISGIKLDFPGFLRPWDCVAFPDIATLRQSGENNLLRAVVVIGEAKIRQRGLHKTNAVQPTKSPNVRAQIAVALHPTMILLVIAYYLRVDTGSIDEIKSPKLGKKTKFGPECKVYGIYYDEVEIVILAHFPQVVEKNPGETCIKFFQIPVAAFALKTGSILERWRMVIALFAVQRHARYLVDKLTSVIDKFSLSSLEF